MAGACGVQPSKDGGKVRKTVYLVSCVSKKNSGLLPASELYCSDWFKKARAYVEAQNAPWLILSAKYGLLSPRSVIRRYNTYLGARPADSRRQWATKVAQQLIYHQPKGSRVVILAGRTYYEYLVPLLREHGYTVDIPLKRLGRGKQLAWLKRKSALLSPQDEA